MSDLFADVESSIPPRLWRALKAFESGPLDQIIRSRRPEDFEALRALAASDAPLPDRYRQKSIYALGRWGNPDASGDIIAVLPRLDEKERISAIDALGRLGPDSARDAVASYRADVSPQVRKFVVQALERLGGRDAAERLHEIASTDPDRWIRDLAEKAVARPEP